MPRKNIALMVIDPQRSFCAKVDSAEQQVKHDGELCVPGAWEDMVRLGDFVRKAARIITSIDATLDSHHYIHIAHPIYWKNIKTSERPFPFTQLLPQPNPDDESIGTVYGQNLAGDRIGEFTTTTPHFIKRAYNYLKALKDGNRYPHMIWPYHCLIGTPGHNVVEPLYDALLNWEKVRFAGVNWLTKGSNYHVEHFSAVRAEVPDPKDDKTQLNTAFIQRVMEADEILLSGEAGSHCLANTVRDMAEFGSDEFVKKCVLLKDATSPVETLEHLQDKFIADMQAVGMRVATTTDYLA